MWRAGLLLSLVWAQSYYLQVRPEATALRAQLLQATQNPSAFARTAPLWQGLSQVELVFPQNLPPELEGWFLVRFTGRDSVALLDSLRKLPEVHIAEAVTQRRLCADPTPLPGWHHVALGTPTAWTLTQGSPSIVIGLLDSGVEWRLPAFHRQLWVNAPEDLNGNGTLDPEDLNGIDEDGNGFIDDVIGYDFTDQPFQLSIGDFLGSDPWPADENGHGTAMASLMVARPDRGPVAGLAPGCRLMNLRCFNAEGYGEDDDIARAILYAVQNGARILNCSFGDERPSQLLQAAIRYAVRAGVVVIAASGNGTGSRPHFPSGFAEVIAAGGCAYEEGTGSFFLWPLSGYYRVDWVAPADRIPALLPSGTISLLSGTSLAAALSSAAAALLLSAHPSLVPADVRASFASRALPLGQPGWSVYSGSGRLFLPPALQNPQSERAGWLYPADEAVIHTAVPFVFSTYHSLLSRWEVSFAPILQGPWTLLKSGTNPSLRDTLQGWLPPSGRTFLRLTLYLRNGGEQTYLLSIFHEPASITVYSADATEGWSDGIAGAIARWRLKLPLPACVEATSRLHCADKIDTVGAIWLPAPFSSPTAALRVWSTTDTLTQALSLPAVAAQALPYAPWQSSPYTAPAGFYLPQLAPDWNSDGAPDLILSAPGANGQPGRLYFLTASGSWQPYDSVSENRPLLPRHLYDWDGDGNPELLCVWMDSFFVLGGSPPKTFLWRREGRAARLDAGESVWLRLDEGSYQRIPRQGPPSLRLPDTLPWNGSTTIPRLLPLHTPAETLWCFGNYAGQIYLYNKAGQLRQTLATNLWDIGSYLLAQDLNQDGWEELLYLGQSREGQSWELGILAGPSWTPVSRVRFWGGLAGRPRMFAAGQKLLLWLPPHLYVGTFQGLRWQAEGFDAEIWGAFGAWEVGGRALFLLGRDTVPRLYELTLPSLPGPMWASPGALSPQEVRLRWHALPTATGYALYRASLSASGGLLLRYTGNDTSFVDGGLLPGETYLYLVRAVGGAFSLPFLVVPGERPCIDTAWIDSSGFCYAHGSSRWEGEFASYFYLQPTGLPARFALASGPQWILQFEKPPQAGDTLSIDTLLTDLMGRYLRGECRAVEITAGGSAPCPSLEGWQIVGPTEVLLRFQGTLPSAAADPNRYKVFPTGAVLAIRSVSEGLLLSLNVSVELWPVTIAWDWSGPNCVRRAAFSPQEVAQQSWGVFPNPLRSGQKQVYFWGLPSGTRVRILSPTGMLCAQFQTTSSEGPLPWVPLTPSGERLAPGLYLIYAEKDNWRATEKLWIE